MVTEGRHRIMGAVNVSDLGETELRGFEDPVRLFELSWRES